MIRSVPEPATTSFLPEVEGMILTVDREQILSVIETHQKESRSIWKGVQAPVAMLKAMS